MGKVHLTKVSRETVAFLIDFFLWWKGWVGRGEKGNDSNYTVVSYALCALHFPSCCSVCM